MLALLALIFAGDGPASLMLEVDPLAGGFQQPVAVRQPPGDDRLFVVEQDGLVRIIRPDGSVAATPFLDLTAVTGAAGERGLLGLAFHPQYPANGRLFVNYTTLGGDFDTVIFEFTVEPADPDRADPTSAREIIRIAQDFSNHNGGDIHFGPDGFLYIGMGDGGSGGDPNERAQDPGSLLGKLLRIDVDSPGANPAGACGAAVNYGIPADNPFVGQSGNCPEIAALGLRNPFRFSFDRARGDLFIGDVGQGRVEEVSFLAAGELSAGVNFGWDCREGDTDYPQAGDPGSDAPVCAMLEGSAALTDPILVYDSFPSRCSVTGGYRYRGISPRLAGVYFFGDFCTGELFAASEVAGAWSFEVVDQIGNIAGFGEARDGSLYVVDYGGSISELGDDTVFFSSFEAGNLLP